MNETKMTGQEMLDILVGKICAGCLGGKHTKRSFCRSCYFKLTPEMRSDLYQLFGEGYEEAFLESLKYLEELKK